MMRSASYPAIAGAILLALAAGAGGLRRSDLPEPVDLGGVARAAIDTARPLLDAPTREPVARLGTFKLTYYYMPSESSSDSGGVQLYTKACRKVGRVSSSFAQKLRMQGGGKLADGRVLIFSGACSCPNSPCYRVARADHTWGTGVEDRPLSPFRSVAVDPSRVSIGSLLYIPELDGLTMPGNLPWGGYVHDGCVVADDRGSGIRGRQIDLFAASHHHYRALDKRHHLKKVTVYDGSERCREIKTRVASLRGSI